MTRWSPAAAAAAALFALCLSSGCIRSRTFTIYSKPPDARLIINGVDRGPGPITHRFEFSGRGDAARVTAVREGYRAETRRLTAESRDDTVVIELNPTGPKAVVSVEPAAMVRVNGRLVRPTPVRQWEIPLNPSQPDEVFTVTAEQPGYARETLTIRSDGPQGYYRMTLKPVRDDAALAQAGRPGGAQSPGAREVPMPREVPSTRSVAVPPNGTGAGAQGSRDAATTGSEPPRPNPAPPRADPPLRRDVVIRTDPPDPGAKISIGGEEWGDREVSITGHEFNRDPATGRSVPQQARATAPGFEGGEVTMRFEDDQPVYTIPLGRRRKEVRIAVDPPDASVTINGETLKPDAKGVVTRSLTFPPKDPPGQPPTVVVARATKQDAGGAWEPAQVSIGWDNGRQDYALKLAPSPLVTVAMLQVVPAWDAKSGWRATGKRVDTVAARDPSESTGRPPAQRFADLPAGTFLDSVVASPDGSHLLYNELIARDGGPLKSRLHLLGSDGKPATPLPSDGQHFDGMPSFTSDGGKIVFTSDREAGGLDVWTMVVRGPPPEGEDPVEQIGRGGEKAALWPMIDASPLRRLFYEGFLKPGAAGATEAASEIRMVELDAKPPAYRRLSPGARPRVSPLADAVVFTRADPATGNRDLYMISDQDGAPFAGAPVNLTNTPQVDETDPAWSRTGARIAYASNAAADAGNRRQYDVYVLTLSDPGRPVRVTHNASWDDNPAWDPTGRSLYFRSNRGGKWGIWKAAVP